jgi:hypothetical protein
MCDPVRQEFIVRSDEPEIKTMDFLAQVMDGFEKEFDDLGINGDVETAKTRIARWFGDKYHVD